MRGARVEGRVSERAQQLGARVRMGQHPETIQRAQRVGERGGGGGRGQGGVVGQRQV